MICSNCKIRWADLLPNYPYEIMTKEDEAERARVFDSDEVKCCPICVEELNAQMDYWKESLMTIGYLRSKSS